ANCASREAYRGDPAQTEGTRALCFPQFALPPGCEAHSRLSSYLPKEDEHDMEVDTATSSLQAPAKHPLPELEIYCYLLVLIFLIDQKKYNEAKACSSTSIARLKT
ncbi:hypothetical protein SLEP1_g59945, partial [Rubroshorea leprosula]